MVRPAMLFRTVWKSGLPWRGRDRYPFCWTGSCNCSLLALPEFPLCHATDYSLRKEAKISGYPVRACSRSRESFVPEFSKLLAD
jgi:hypothetical protein